MDTCGFVQVDCANGCGVRFERRFAPKHQIEDCPKRTVVCEFCMIVETAYDTENSLLFVKVKETLSLKKKFLI